MPDSKKYRAFISYSHADEAWAKWLHRALETYRVPSRLRRGDRAALPKRLLPIFRDRDELPSAAELGSVVQEALRHSEALIVICSPRAAGSRWVNEEIRYFKSLGRAQQVLALIVDGEPHAAEAAQECFPTALQFVVTAQGALSAETVEPIAADAREGRDGRHDALLKVIAGLLGVGFDDLQQRERQRQFWQRLQQGFAVLAMAALLVGAWQWFERYKRAQAHEVAVEQLMEQGRLALLAQQSGRAAQYLTAALREGRDTPVLRFMLGQAMRPVEALSARRMQVDGYVTRPAFTPDDARVIVPAVGKQLTLATVFDLATGAKLHTLQGLPRAPQITEVLPGGDEVLISGLAESSDRQRRGAQTGIWDLRTGQQRLALAGHAGLFGRPMPDDGLRLVTADGPQPTEAQIVEVASSRVLHRLRSATPLRAASFSPDGEWVITGDESGRALLWRAADGRLQRPLAGSMGAPVVGLQITTDGKRAIAISQSGDVRIWQLPQGELQLAFAADPKFVSDIRLDRTGQRLLSIGSQGYKVWDTERGTLLFARNIELDWYGTADIQPGGETLALITTNDAQMNLYELDSRRLRLSLEPEDTALTAAAFSHTGTQMLMGSFNGTIRLLHRIPGPSLELAHPPAAYAASFSPNGQQIATVGKDQQLRVWDARTGKALFHATGHVGRILQVLYDASGERIATAAEDGQLRLWNAKDGTPLSTTMAHPDGVLKLLPSADHQWAASVPYPNSLKDFTSKIWSLRDGRLLHTLTHPALVRDAHFSPDGELLATACADGQLRVWSVRDGQLRGSFALSNSPLVRVNFRADGKALIGVDETQGAEVISWPEGQIITELVVDPSDKLIVNAIPAPGSSWAVASSLGKLKVWQPQRQQWANVAETSQPLIDLAYLGPHLLLGSQQDGVLRVWDADRRMALLDVAAHAYRTWNFSIERDDSSLLTVGLDGKIRVWPIAPEHRQASTLEALLNCRLPANAAIATPSTATTNCDDGKP